MKVLFCHDGPILKDEYNNYYGTVHNDEMFKRYHIIADKIGVLIRVKNVDKEHVMQKYSRITLSTLDIIECPNLSNIKGILNKRKIKKIIKNEIIKSDYIVIRLPSFIGLLAVDVAKKLDKPYLIEVVACPWDALWNYSLKGKLIAPYMYFATKKRVYNGKYVLYVTNKFLQRRYPTKGMNINCSDVALKDVDEKVLKSRIDKILNLDIDNKIIIGTAASVSVRYKGQQYIIKALGKLKKQGIKHFEYQLVGSGDQSYLKSLAKKYDVEEQVKFLGSLPHDKVFDWLDSIDIYVQPSRQEGLPRALIEAMSRGLPAFGANTGGIPELLEPDFIFSNTRKNINEICNILLTFNKENMIKQSLRNYNEALKYKKDFLNKIREDFFHMFVVNSNS